MAVTMTALWSYERLGDWQGERDELAARLRRYTQFPPVARRMLEFRLALLDEKLGGPDPLPRFLEDPIPEVRTAADLLVRQRQSGDALITFYANMPAKFFLDGREIVQAGHPERPVAIAAPLPPGRHVLAIQTPRQSYPDWVQLAVSCRDWFVGTDPTWKFACNPVGEWAAMDHDDSAWAQVGGTGVKGPPEEPYIWVEPDPFLGMQSRALGIRPPAWPAGGGFVVYRKVVDVP